MEQWTQIPLSRECREWWMMMNKCCDVVLFVKLCLSLTPFRILSGIRFHVWRESDIFSSLNVVPMLFCWCLSSWRNVFLLFHFGYPFCFSSRGNLHWLMLWYAHKIIESSTCSTTCFALCFDTRRKCVCMYVELCSFRVLKVFFNYIVSVLVNQPPCPISFHCHQQTFFTFYF